MGFRLSKRVKILPGLTLNLSKSGVSISAGVRGAKVTVSKNGVRQTVGIPGTGLSHTTYTKHSNNSAPKTSYSSSSSQPQASVTSVGVLIALGLLLLFMLAITKPSLILLFVIVSAIYFARKKYNKTDASIEYSPQSQQIDAIENPTERDMSQSGDIYTITVSDIDPALAKLYKATDDNSEGGGRLGK